jgi:hypothetical protein
MTSTTDPGLSLTEAGELIAEPPTTFTEHDLDHELRPDPPSRWGRRFTSALLLLTVLAVGAVSGAFAQKQWGSASSGGTASNGSLSSSITGGFGGGFGGGAGFGPDGGTPPTGAPPAGFAGGPPAGG